ncbi:MAG: hypothetical protein LWW95_07800 [Candidatus Desulfofervidus auxilii]|nr:hypothetical protein [Candidatus Desulfofervidus auxilii]
MFCEFYFQILLEEKQSIKQIEELKIRLEEIKKDKSDSTKEEKKKIENELNRIYDNLCQKQPALFYQYMKVHGKDAESLKTSWIKNLKNQKEKFKKLERNFKELFDKIIPKIDKNYISILPKYSFAIQFKFKLAKPYISKDDREFYILDNPIKKEWVFKIPMVSPSTWKGNLRWTIRKIKGLTDEPFKSDDEQIIRLFGNEKEETEAFNQGYLVFYPTFFFDIDVEVINPHDRRTKAGKRPIFIEAVPKNTEGTFTLVYVSLENDLNKAKDFAKEDLEIVINGIKEMMFKYGFSAKKSSGYGIIKDELNSCQLIMNGVSLSFDEIESTKFEFFKERKDLIVKELKKN